MSREFRPSRASSTWARMADRSDMNSGSAASASRFSPAVDREIPVEQRVRGGLPAVADEIHHRECKVVEHIDRGDLGIELDRIEQDGLAIDQYDVRQMQVAMAAPHISLPAALLQQCREFRQMPTASCPRSSISSDGKQAASRNAAVLPSMSPGNRIDPGFSRRERRNDVGGRDRIRDGVDETGIERTGFGQMVDGPALVEARHFDRIFDRRALAVDFKRSVVALRDRQRRDGRFAARTGG